jgi:hypothetical protein
MSIYTENLHSALVKVKSVLTGSGVWLNFGLTNYSYVITAAHNIKDDKVEIYDKFGNQLESSKIIKLEGIDISIIQIEQACNNKIEFCLGDNNKQETTSKSWILGYPNALVKTSTHKATEHEGTILIKSDSIIFRIDEILPPDKDKSNIEGFSGGPIFEVINDIIYLKGIITDSLDNNFSYSKIEGIKTEKIYDLLPQELKDEFYNRDIINDIAYQACCNFKGKISEYILENNLINKLDNIDFDYLKDCKYFYLPDDKDKSTQHISLIRNKASLEAYIHSRIITIITDDSNPNVIINPSKFENENIFTIHVTEFKRADQLVAKLIRQENSFDYNNSIILIIHSDANNNLEYWKKKRISRVISNFASGNEPELYDDKADLREKMKIRSFLDDRKNAGVKFAVINIDFIVKRIISHIEDELYGEPYDKNLLTKEIVEVIKLYA